MTIQPAPLYPDPTPPGFLGGSPRRIMAMVMRNWFLIRKSWPRILELCYWPTVQLLVWGFMSQFLRGQSSLLASAAGVLISAVLLWEVLVRTQIGMSITFLEELWSRNLGNLFVSPLRPWEWVVSLVVMGFIRVILGLGPPVVLAIAFFDVSLFDLGLPLAGFFANLMMLGVAVGLLTAGMILRHGLGAESLCWMAVFVLAPFSAVYYPLSSLPSWLQYLCVSLPSTHVFEGMRAVLFNGIMDWSRLGWAIALNLFYLTLASLYFLGAFRGARRRGALLQAGE
ncbi:ABC transporter [Niveispirillum lacus]|uniref:Transport permease protein n=1 Tax=Niveispirillum lacus TaxID=1981099 RepID=A0A255YY56_9PROT|nr:ABC transporter permease [Niveispirillum lacus]OYQ34109.1 ABC transporter [Niveispirillum lacus]